MAYITTQLCTMLFRHSLGYSPPFPIDIQSPLGVRVGALPFGSGSLYGLGTTQILKFVRRNYEPRIWRATGSANGTGTVIGYSETAGDPSNPIFEELEIPIIFDEIVSGPSTTPYGFFRPDFSRNPRTICDLTYTQVGPVINGVYPIGFDIETGLTYAGYLFPTISISIHLAPYSWSRQGVYYLEHECRVDVGLSASRSVVFGDPFSPDEGVQFGGSASMQSRMDSISKVLRGTISVIDPIMDDQLGAINLWSDGGTPGTLFATANLTLTCTSHFLPTPGY